MMLIVFTADTRAVPCVGAGAVLPVSERIEMMSYAVRDARNCDDNEIPRIVDVFHLPSGATSCVSHSSLFRSSGK